MIDFTTYPLFPDLLDNQRRSIEYFLEKGILEELELFSYMGNNSGIGISQGSNHRTKGSGAKAYLPSPKLGFSGEKLEEIGKVRKFFGENSRNFGNSSFAEISGQTLGNKKLFHSRTVFPRIISSRGGVPLSYGLSLEEKLLQGTVFRQSPEKFSDFIFQLAGEDSKKFSQAHQLDLLNKNDESKRYGSASFSSKALLNGYKMRLRDNQNPKINNSKPSFEIILHSSKYIFRQPKYTEIEAIRQQKTYSAGFYIPVEIRQKGGRESPGIYPGELSLSSGPRWYYFGDIPLMTERGSFLINGAPRVLVNQIIRCPSVYFKVKLDEKNRRSYIASFLSDYGSWLRLETDRLRPRLWVRIDKSPRFPLEFFLQALGFGSQFFSAKFSGLRRGVAPQGRGSFAEFKNEKSVSLGGVEKREGGNPGSLENLEILSRSSLLRSNAGEHGPSIFIPASSIQLIWKKCNPGRWGSAISCYSFFYNKFFNPRRYSIGRVGRLRLNKRLNRSPECQIPTLTPEDVLLALDYLLELQNGIQLDGFGLGRAYLDDIDHLKNRRVRLPGEILQNQFRLALSRVMTGATIAMASKNSADLKGSTPGKELGGLPSLLNSKQGGVAANFSSESASNFDPNLFTTFFGGSPSQSFVSTLRELFNTSQLSQYMDQTNPLAEITHKRRLTSLGPGGVSRDQAGFAVREIHPSHFGRICPIETPEGQNAGLVGSLASYARINENGFLQSPVMRVSPQGQGFGLTQAVHEDREVSLQSQKSARGNQRAYLFTSEIEDEVYLCTADIGRALELVTLKLLSSKGKNSSLKNLGSLEFLLDPVPTRFKQEFISSSPTRIQFRGVCPIQMISVATSLIPFLEHDDANRALMGSNMQRQAVPLMIPTKPLVGTGFEIQAARDSSTILLAPKSGYVEYLDAREVKIQSVKPPEGNILQDSQTSVSGSKLSFLGYDRSNQSTSLRQRPAVEIGEWVEKGDLLADGSATHDGEVALGKNILLAYLPWEGYNFEDAIVINERLVYEDIYSSIHIERYELDVRNIAPLQFRTEFGLSGSQPAEVQEPQEKSKQAKGGNPQEIEISQDSSHNSSNVSAKIIWPPVVGTEYITRDLDIFLGFGSRTQNLSDQNESTAVADSAEEFLSPLAASIFDQIRDLDNDGIVKVGTWVEESSILIGKVTAQASSLARKSSSKALELQRRGGPSSSVAVRGAISAPGSSPEYRLLLAILGNEGSGRFSVTSRVGTEGGGTHSASLSSSSDGRELGSSPGPQSFIRFQNTSIKAGVGLRGRVIDCIVPWRTSITEEVMRSSSLSKTQISGVRDEADNARAKLSSTPLQIFIAHKKRIQVGDKMSGRHGNKGIVSLILPPQDMPYLQDGSPVDIVLNPLGVPSRMNVGQVLETLFGLAAKYLHEIYRLIPFESKTFDSAEVFGNFIGVRGGGTGSSFHGSLSPGENNLSQDSPRKFELKSNNEAELGISSIPETSRSIVYAKLQEARNRTGYPWLFDPNTPGKMEVFDGRTGEVFDHPILVGYSYMFKLIHLVDDKIHARSTGPYSLVTQQPLGGRSKKGGQRLGEMEVWACEGFGAAYLLQEFLTLKSDEIYSRNTFLLNLMKRNSESEEFAGVRGSSLTPPPKRFLHAKARWLDLPKNEEQRGGVNPAVRARNFGKSYVPESFRVLVNELQSLCLSIYYNPDFRLSYPSLLGRESKFPGLGGG